MLKLNSICWISSLENRCLFRRCFLNVSLPDRQIRTGQRVSDWPFFTSIRLACRLLVCLRAGDIGMDSAWDLLDLYQAGVEQGI